MDPLLPLVIVLALLVDGSTAPGSAAAGPPGPRCSSLGYRPAAIVVPLRARPTTADVAKTSAARDLRQLADFMRARGCRVAVDGYASPDGKNNTAVSQRRALAVRTFLIEQRVAKGAIDARGRGVLRDPGLSEEQQEIARVLP